MLFSENPDQLIDELKDYIQIASSYDCSRIQNLLLATENTYIIALLGTKLFNRIAKDQTTFPDEIGMCRKAVANITVYENFTLLNTLLLSGGFARVAGENTDSLYRYQEEDLKQIFRRNGFDQLDLIISHFLDKIDSFPEFKESEYYKAGRGELIPDRFVFSQYYKPIGHIVFRYLQAFIRRAEDLDISDIVDLSELRQAVLSRHHFRSTTTHHRTGSPCYCLSGCCLRHGRYGSKHRQCRNLDGKKSRSRRYPGKEPTGYNPGQHIGFKIQKYGKQIFTRASETSVRSDKYQSADPG